MAIETSVNIDVNVDGTATVKQAAQGFEDLGDAVAKTQREVEALALQYGINDQRTQEAIKRAGQYKGQLEQLDQAIDANKGGMEGMFRAVQGVAAGFELAGGAMALFGSESEELEKALIKVQGAMVFAQGLKDIKEFAPALKNVGMVVAGPLINAFRSFGVAARAAIASTGIGLLVVAVGSLVAYWDQIKESLTGVSQAQKDVLENQTKSTKLAKEQLDDITAQENILRLQGKTEEEILQLKIQGTKTLIAGLEAQLVTQQQIKEQQVETAKRNKELLEGLIMFAYAPIEIILKGIDLALNALGRKSDLVGSFTSGLASLVFDPEEVEKKGNETIKATEKELSSLKNSIAGYELGIKKIRQDNYKQQQDDLKKAKEEERRIEDEAFEQWLAQEVENDNYRQRLEQERLAKEEEDFQNWIAQEIENEEYRTRKKQEEADKRKQIEQDLFNASQDLANAIISLAGEQSKIGKGIALAQVAADTARALSGALANSNSPTADNVATGGLAGIAKYITLAATILTNAKRARDIIKSGNTSYSTASPSLPSATVANATIRSSSLPQSENILATNRKVYVLEGDITRTQRRAATNQNVSVLGG